MTLNPWALLLHHACRTLFSGCEYTRGYLSTVIMATEAKKQRDRISVLAATRSDTRTHALGIYKVYEIYITYEGAKSNEKDESVIQMLSEPGS